MACRTSQYLELGRSLIYRITMDAFVGFLSIKLHAIRVLLKQSETSTSILHTPMERICFGVIQWSLLELQ